MPNFAPHTNPAPNEMVKSIAPLIKNPRCGVCAHPSRALVDQMLVAGLSFSEIERQFEHAEEPISRGSISNHSKRHLSFQEAAIRRVIEKQATEDMKNIEETADLLITKKAFLEVAVQRGFKSLVDETMELRLGDVVKAIETLDKLEDKGSAIAIERFKAEHDAFMQAVKETVPDHFYADIIAKTKTILGETIEGHATEINSNSLDKGNA